LIAKDSVGCRIGVDESGKGDYFGYLVVACVLVDESSEEKLKKLGVKDSKLLSDFAVKERAKDVKKICPYEIVKISPDKYNVLYKKFGNLNSLLAWAHSRAIENMLSKHRCDFIISDRFSREGIEKHLLDKGRKVRLVQEINAERDMAVAAASIIARDEFLKTLRKLSYDIGYKLPKGASDVQEAAKHLVEKYGPEILQGIAKTHFKITKKILKKQV
jgi:ribonuclease HIII